MINRIYNTFVFLIIIGLCFYSCNDDEKQKEKYKIMTLKVAAYRDYYVAPEHGITTNILGYVVTDETTRHTSSKQSKVLKMSMKKGMSLWLKSKQ